MAQNAEQVLVPHEVLRQPPSVVPDNPRGSLSFEEEAEQRMYGASWIQQASVLLKVPAVTMASGQTIFHRFYYRRSMFDFDVKLIAAASLYLGCKLEETPRRVRDLVNISVYMDWLDERESRIAATLAEPDDQQEKQPGHDEQHEQQQQQPRQRKEPDPFLVSNTPPLATSVGSSSSPSPTSGGEKTPSVQLDEPPTELNIQCASTSSAPTPCTLPRMAWGKKPQLQRYLDVAKLLEDLDSTLRLPDIHSRDFRRLKTNIHRAERHILRETGFMISQTLVHPHRYILQYIHSLLGNNTLVPTEWKAAVGQRAWGYLNDSLRTPLCCSFQPAAITSAAIFMAARDYGFILPKDSAWYLLFEVAWEDLVQVCKMIQSVYTAPKPRYRKLAVPPIPPPVHPC